MLIICKRKQTQNKVKKNSFFIWIFFPQKWKQNQNSSSHFYQKIEYIFHTPLLGLLWNCCRDCLLWCREWMSFPISSKRDAPQFGVCSLFGAIGKDILDERGWNYTLNLVKVFCVRSLLKATTPKKQWNRR